MWPNLKQKDGNVLQKPKLILFLLGRKNVLEPLEDHKIAQRAQKCKNGPKWGGVRRKKIRLYLQNQIVRSKKKILTLTLTQK